MMLGENQLGSFCRGQGVTSLTFRESKFYGIAIGSAEGLGEQSHAKDMRDDSTTGAAIAFRKCLGMV